MKARLPRWAVWFLGAAGAVLIIVLLRRLGLALVAGQVARLVPVLPIVLALGAIKYTLQTIGWRIVLRPDERPPWSDALSATIAGNAVGYLTWAGPVSAEPTRAVLTRHLLPVGVSVAAGAAERFMYVLTSVVLVVSVLAALVWSAHPSWHSAWRMLASLQVLAGAWAGAVRGGRQPRAARSWRRPFDAVRDFWREHRKVAPALASLCFGQHAILVVEAYVMLHVLGAHPTAAETLVFEVISKIVNTAGSAVPGRIGISEGGSALVAGALGYQVSVGVSLALMRRIRALIWSAVGLLLLVTQERRARRSGRTGTPASAPRPRSASSKRRPAAGDRMRRRRR